MHTLAKTIMQNTFNKYYACSVASYESALKALHNLQSNAEYLKAAAKSNFQASSSCKLLNVQNYLFRSGIVFNKLDTLSVIHVAGTKGKGSTCAYTEAILRENGFRTGFFSSPHLVTVRERIRINGQPISQMQFAQYFWKIYKKLEDAKEHEYDMPGYFNFLTVLMFNIFLAENVDVAVIEVGIGGLYDCTNIVRNPVCVGITSLALDHTSLLGNSIEDIAYQKSGIFKPKAIAFTVPQLPQAMQVLQKIAIERNCTLHVIPPFDEYMWENLSPILKIANKVQQQNASLAIQMATEWISSKANKYDENNRESVSMDKIAIGLSSCKWPARMQILRSSIADFFLDGAHTIESMESCISWFTDISGKSNGKKFLIFNTSGTREAKELLTPLKSLHFYKAYFVPNFAGVQTIDDEINNMSLDEQIAKCEMNSALWGTNSLVRSSVLEILQDINSEQQRNVCHYNNERYQILVTGSLHLIGAILTILDPNLTMTTQL